MDPIGRCMRYTSLQEATETRGRGGERPEQYGRDVRGTKQRWTELTRENKR